MTVDQIPERALRAWVHRERGVTSRTVSALYLRAMARAELDRRKKAKVLPAPAGAKGA